MTYKPKTTQPTSEAAATAGAGAAGTIPEASAQPGALSDQIDSSQPAGSGAQANQPSTLFKPLPAFKLADPKLLATAPEFQKITSLYSETADDKDKKEAKPEDKE